MVSLRPLFSKSTVLQLKTPMLLSSIVKAEPGSRKFTLVPWMSSAGDKNNSSDFYECLLCARKPLVYELHILGCLFYQNNLGASQGSLTIWVWMGAN